MYPPAPNKPMKLLVAIVGALALAAPAFADPDLILDGNYAAATTTQYFWTFPANDCRVLEGSAPAGYHKLLTFGIETANIGLSDLVVGSPKRNDPANWEYSACHDHWHFKNYVQYQLYDLNGVAVGSGVKESFCIEDTDPYLSTAGPRAHYTCKRQGISAGWADIYTAGLQYVTIDGLPAGQYTLVATVNFAGYLPESDYSNNTMWVPILIS